MEQLLPQLSYSSILTILYKASNGALLVRGTSVKRRPEWNGDLEPVTPLRQSGALANYAIPAYKSFPSDSNQQPADYKSAALPLRQRSMIGAAGIEPTSTVYKTAALPLDEAPLKTVDPGSGIGEGLVFLISNH